MSTDGEWAKCTHTVVEYGGAESVVAFISGGVAALALAVGFLVLWAAMQEGK